MQFNTFFFPLTRKKKKLFNTKKIAFDKTLDNLLIELFNFRVSALIPFIMTLNEMFANVSTLLDCPTLSLNKYISLYQNDSIYFDFDAESASRINDAVIIPSTS